MQQKNKILLKSEHILLDTSAVVALLKKEKSYKYHSVDYSFFKRDCSRSG